MKRQKVFVSGKFYRIIRNHPDVITVEEKSTGHGFSHLPYIPGEKWARENLKKAKIVFLALENFTRVA